MKQKAEFAGSALAGWNCGDAWYSPFCDAGETILKGKAAEYAGTGGQPPAAAPTNYTPLIIGGGVLLVAVALLARK